MKNFCTITPTRGDRNELLNFTLSRIPAGIEKIVVDYAPISDAVDIVPRIKAGIELAKFKGYQYAVIVEDDDYYPVEYFEVLDKELNEADFFGYENTLYYNLRNRTYATMQHENRSSLFCTAFRIDALKNFPWPSDKQKFLDIKIWEYSLNGFKVRLSNHQNPCIGIKHGIGLCGGKGHYMTLANSDNDLSFLKSNVDKSAFEFYRMLIEKLYDKYSIGELQL